MKYLFVSSDKFPPFRVDVSELFGKEMVQRGHRIDFLLQSDASSRKPYTTQWSGCRVFVGANDGGNSIVSKIKKNVLNVVNDIKLFGLQRRHKYDFILVKDKFFAGVLAVLASILFGVPFCYWLSFPIPESNLHRSKLPNARFPMVYRIRGRIFKILLYKLLMPRATHIFAQSEYMMKNIQMQGVEEKKITPVPMGVASDLFNFKPSAKASPGQQHPKIVYLGTLVAVRRMDFVIRAFKHVHEKFPDAKLYMVGDSDQKRDIDSLKREAEMLGIRQSVVFTGFLPRKEALSHVWDADVCISPIYPTPILNLGSPTKIIEYMALKKPVVANDHPEQEYILDHSRAGICVPWNEIAFGDGICYLLNRKDEASEMGIRGYAFIKQERSYSIIAEKVHHQLCKIKGD